MLLVLCLVGLMTLGPMSLRLAFWGQRRELHRRWLGWLPVAAPLIWVLSNVATVLAMRDRFVELSEVPIVERSTAVSDGIAGAFELTLVGAGFAVLLLAACFGYFLSRPPKKDGFDDGEPVEHIA